MVDRISFKIVVESHLLPYPLLYHNLQKNVHIGLMNLHKDLFRREMNKKIMSEIINISIVYLTHHNDI